MDALIDRLRFAIQKFKTGIYSEIDFHVTIESIRSSANSSLENEVFIFLTDITNELERIDFLVEDNLKKGQYLNQIRQIELFIKDAS